MNELCVCVLTASRGCQVAICPNQRSLVKNKTTILAILQRKSVYLTQEYVIQLAAKRAKQMHESGESQYIIWRQEKVERFVN